MLEGGCLCVCHLISKCPFYSSILCLCQTVLDLYKQRGFKTVPEPMLAVMQTLPALRLTIWDGGEEMIPVQDVGKLGLQEVAKLYTVSKSLSTPFCHTLPQRQCVMTILRGCMKFLLLCQVVLGYGASVACLDSLSHDQHDVLAAHHRSMPSGIFTSQIRT